MENCMKMYTMSCSYFLQTVENIKTQFVNVKILIQGAQDHVAISQYTTNTLQIPEIWQTIEALSYDQAVNRHAVFDVLLFTHLTFVNKNIYAVGLY